MKAKHPIICIMRQTKQTFLLLNLINFVFVRLKFDLYKEQKVKMGSLVYFP